MKKAISQLLECIRKPKSEPIPPLNLERLQDQTRCLQDQIIYLQDQIRCFQDQIIYLQDQIRCLQEKHEAALENYHRTIAGTVVLAHAETHPELKEYLFKLLDIFLDSNEDRRLFGLELRKPVSSGGPFRIKKL